MNSARNAELIRSSITCSQIIDLTAACGTGKSTVLPVMIKEIVGVERVYVLEPRRQLAVENAISSKQYLCRERLDNILITHCIKDDVIPSLYNGIVFFIDRVSKIDGQYSHMISKIGIYCKHNLFV